MRNRLSRYTFLALIFVSSNIGIGAQPTAFTYQGRLTDAGNAANGNFQMQFKLFDAVSAGSQIGTTLSDVPVTVTNGTFSVRLDFGSSPFVLAGANRFLEVAVRRNSGESYVTLTPREQLTSSPYSLRTLSAALADDSQRLGGVAASEYITNTSAGTNFIRNQTTQQPASNFNISGNGVVGGSLGIGATPAGGKLAVVSQTAIDGNNTAYFEAQNIGPFVSNIHYGTTGDWYIRSASSSGKVVIQDTGGNVGVGTSSPAAGYRMDVAGPVKSSGDSTHFVAQTTGGTNSWARFYTRSNAQSWFIGTSQGFNGNQFYIVDETFNRTRISIQPNAGPIKFEGSMAQDLAYRGLPKLMIQIAGDGTIASCYSGLTGTTCTGVTSTRLLTGTYRIDAGFLQLGPYVMVTPRQAGRFATHTATSGNTFDVTSMGADGFLLDSPLSIVVF